MTSFTAGVPSSARRIVVWRNAAGRKSLKAVEAELRAPATGDLAFDRSEWHGVIVWRGRPPRQPRMGSTSRSIRSSRSARCPIPGPRGALPWRCCPALLQLCWANDDRFMALVARREPAYLSLHRRNELVERARAALGHLASCDLCARYCRVDRLETIRGAVCRTGRRAVVASYGPHHGEERPFSGCRAREPSSSPGAACAASSARTGRSASAARREVDASGAGGDDARAPGASAATTSTSSRRARGRPDPRGAAPSRPRRAFACPSSTTPAGTTARRPGARSTA